MQSSGINYLIPVDASIPGEAFLKTKALPAQAVLDTLQQCNNGLNIVVLDACRDNPFGCVVKCALTMPACLTLCVTLYWGSHIVENKLKKDRRVVQADVTPQEKTGNIRHELGIKLISEVSMIQIFKLSLLQFALIALIGCASVESSIEGKVESLTSDKQIKSYTYIVLSGNQAVKETDLKFGKFANILKKNLLKNGFTVTDDKTGANAVVFFSYSISDPHTLYAGDRQIASYNSYTNQTDATSKAVYKTTYVRNIILDAYEFDPLADTTGAELWRVANTSEGATGDLQSAYPYLLAMIQKYYGVDSNGEQLERMTIDNSKSPIELTHSPPASIAAPSGSKNDTQQGSMVTGPLPKNSVGIVLAPVAGGSFQVAGEGHLQLGKYVAAPPRQIIVSNFYIAQTDVTQDQYQAITGTNPSHFTGANNPVEQVSWFDAVAFCNALSVKEGLRSVYTINGKEITCNFDANGYRLPTEAEWEYAAKGGQGGIAQNIPFSVDKVAWTLHNSKFSSHPVGQKDPNALGLYDMVGNVWQWCNDYFGPAYNSNPEADPQSGSGISDRMCRGGSFDYIVGNEFPNTRFHHSPDYKFYNIGFRVARSKIE